MHAAVIAINDAIDHQDAEGTMQALRNPNAHLTNIDAENAEEYQSALYQAKTSKAESSMAKVSFSTLCANQIYGREGVIVICMIGYTQKCTLDTYCLF